MNNNNVIEIFKFVFTVRLKKLFFKNVNFFFMNRENKITNCIRYIF